MPGLISAAGNTVQSFVPDPLKSQVSSAMTGTVIFGKGSGTVDITSWTAIRVNPGSDSYYYFNNDTTKTYPLPGGVTTDIFCFLSLVAQVVIVFSGSGNSVQGM